MKNIVRNDSPVGFSWLVNCFKQGSLRISLAFLNLIVLSLKHGNDNKEFEFSCQVDKNYPGDVVTIRKPGVFLSSSHGGFLYKFVLADFFISSVAFFITTTLPSVLWLYRSPKKGQNFNLQTVIGSDKAISAQNVAGVWGVC